jgi:carboxypeptidase C (cathepsin A)
MRLFSTLAAGLCGLSMVTAGPISDFSNRERHEIFEDRRWIEKRDGVDKLMLHHRDTNSQMEIVTNSGVCETTPGVTTYSGYFSVGPNMNMWFWFFEARNSPKTAPLVTWFNGGPGCSSMIGLFQENGPCQFYNNSTEPSINKYSFNEYANMLYIDQPIGTGFSYGDDEVNSTVTAAPYVWNLLQAFLGQFPKYESRDFAIFTESYGGHYGPEFASYIETQNAAIKKGTVKGEKLNLVALAINNGWIEPEVQFKAYIDYALTNPYKKILNQTYYNQLLSSYEKKCLPMLQKCYSTGANKDCEKADDYCNDNMYYLPTTVADFDVYDVREPSVDPFPPETYVNYLQRADIMKKIGAKVQYQECPDAPYDKFIPTGDGTSYNP